MSGVRVSSPALRRQDDRESPPVRSGPGSGVGLSCGEQRPTIRRNRLFCASDPALVSIKLRSFLTLSDCPPGVDSRSASPSCPPKAVTVGETLSVEHGTCSVPRREREMAHFAVEFRGPSTWTSPNLTRVAGQLVGSSDSARGSRESDTFSPGWGSTSAAAKLKFSSAPLAWRTPSR